MLFNVQVKNSWILKIDFTSIFRLIGGAQKRVEMARQRCGAAHNNDEGWRWFYDEFYSEERAEERTVKWGVKNWVTV